MNIRIINQALSQKLSTGSLASRSKWSRLKLWQKTSTRKRLIRYGILAANALVLVIVVMFVWQNPVGSKSTTSSLITAGLSDDIAANPLDQLSSADIAAHVAIITNLAEANSVTNNADSYNDQLSIASTDEQVIAKPQVINTTTKTRKDIITYVVQAGDSVPSLAAKFGISSETIRWSNNLTGDSLSVGKQLNMSPVNGGIVYLVKKGDTVEGLAGTYHTNKESIIAFNDTEVGGLPVGQLIVIPGGSIVAARSSNNFNWFGSGAIYASNGYDFGWCTWYAANRRAQIGRPVPSNLGNAYSWYERARALGLPVGLSPAVGAVAVSSSNHVSIVEVVNADGSFWVSEMNSRGQVSMTDPTPAGGWNRIDWKLFPSTGSLKFVY